MNRRECRKEGACCAWLLLFLWVSLAGCTSYSIYPPGPWHEIYEPISVPSSQDFVSSVLAQAEDEFGAPKIPVEQVMLRRSRKRTSFARYRVKEDFSLTECVDVHQGVFVIYMGVGPNHPDYRALLAHECVHLLNPHITDWYMEGIATLFSEQVCMENGIDWSALRRHFETAKNEPYAVSYRMMKELKGAFPHEYPLIVQCVAPNERAGDEWKRIDIDAWIASLPFDRQHEALSIIEPYAKVLSKERNELYDFVAPSGVD